MTVRRFSKLTKRIKGKTIGSNGDFRNDDKPHGFMFFREKMVAMIAYFLMDAKLVPMFYAPVPVDFHILRLLTSNQILRVRGMNAKQAVGVDFMTAETQRLAREVTEWYCRNSKISPIALTDCLWLLSRSFCRDNPGNSGYVVDSRREDKLKKVAREERDRGTLLDEGSFAIEFPADQEVPKGRKRYIGLKWSAETLFSVAGRVRRFERSCGNCPVQDHCRYNITSGGYYVGGKLMPERLRVIPSSEQDHFLDHHSFSGTRKARIDPTIRFAKIVMER